MRKNKTKIFVFIFGCIFIFGSFFSFINIFYQYSNKTNAKYKQETVGVVLSINKHKESRNNQSYGKNRMLNDSYYVWTTTEEIQVENGENFIYDGYYLEEPTTNEISHTIVSKDGISWKVNDTNKRDILPNLVVFIIMMIFGFLITKISKRI